jgi:hypothetical protein
MLSIIMPYAIMPNVIILNVVILNVVAPMKLQQNLSVVFFSVLLSSESKRGLKEVSDSFWGNDYKTFFVRKKSFITLDPGATTINLFSTIVIHTAEK